MTPTFDPDTELMLAFQRGDESAFTSLFELYRIRVMNIAYRFLANRDASEDVAQEVFVKIYSSAKSYRPSAKFSTWLYRIAVNTCLDRIRKCKKDGIEITLDIEIESPSRSPELLVESNELVKEVRAAIISLPENQRIAIILQRYENLNHKETAEVLNISVSAVESLLFRAKQSLKNKLASYVQLPAETNFPEQIPV